MGSSVNQSFSMALNLICDDREFKMHVHYKDMPLFPLKYLTEIELSMKMDIWSHE